MTGTFLDLLVKLKETTILDRVTWEEAGESNFRAILNSGMVRIGEEKEYEWSDDINDHIPRKRYRAWLLSPEGSVVEELSRSHDEADYGLLESLYVMARSHARRSEALIRQMLEELTRSTA